MATVTTFSPFSFYSAANGTPLEDAVTVETYQVPLPVSPGVTILPRDAGALSTSASSALHTITTSRAHLIASIQHGEIPTLSLASTRSDIPLFHTHPPLEELQSSSVRVQELLKVTHPLATRAHGSLHRACPRCGDLTTRYRTATEIFAEVAPRIEGTTVSLKAVGPFDPLTRWTSSQGFTATSGEGRYAEAQIDSFTCDKVSFEANHGIIHAILHTPELAIRISTSNEIMTFARGGWCQRCETSLRVPSLSEIRESLLRGEGEALSLTLNGQPLSKLLRTPIEKLMAGGYIEELLDTPVLDAMRITGLLGLHLNEQLRSLSPQTVGALVMIATLASYDQKYKHFLLDIPLSLYTTSSASTLVEAAKHLAGNSSAVWLTDTPVESSLACRRSTTVAGARPLGILQLLHQTPLTISTNVATMVRINQGEKYCRPSLEVYRALSGERSSACTYSATSPQTIELVECLVPAPSSPKLLAHEIGALEPLAKLFAASHQARMLGLSSKDFSIGQTKIGAHVCLTCRGAGVIISRPDRLSPPIVSPCSRCWGTRFRAPAREITFKGRTLWQTLNSSLHENAAIFRALPKMSHVLNLAEILSLGSLPLGIPIACLSQEQRRGVALMKAMLSGTASKPTVIVLEEPFVGLAPSNIDQFCEALLLPHMAQKVAWVIVENHAAETCAYNM
jgi:hypothetical protein